MKTLDLSTCPERFREGLERFVLERIKPGHFLMAVLENNLVNAINRADLQSQRELVPLVTFIYNEIPSECWGSRDKVHRWLVGNCRHNVSMADRCFDCDPNIGVEERQ